MRFLQGQGARFMSFAELLRGDFPSADEFGVIVTFDDGFRDVYENALPVLDSLRIPGTVFQCSAMVDSDELIWEHALYYCWRTARLRSELLALLDMSGKVGDAGLLQHVRERIPLPTLEAALAEVLSGKPANERQALARKLYPRSGQLRDAVAAGHAVGSHGHRHYLRASISAGQFDDELATSRAALAAATGQGTDLFSWPFNSRSPGDREICARHFRVAATVDGFPLRRGFDFLELPRINWPGEFPNALRRRRWLWTGG
jgi:peptidoglycan/xylan/chitin deacetylase (PgdA/CDA1 family)